VANSAQAKKRARQAEVSRELNAGHRSKVRTFIKKVVNAIEAKNKTVAQEAYEAAVPVIDSMVNKKIIHRNKAARHKSRLAKRIAAIAA
jgi:small subunit ribosomal protein S20